jgi:protein-glutamine gamma-glutamyltransferase
MVVNVTKSVESGKVSIVQQWRRRIQTLPLMPPEESIALRVLTQALVVIGMIATDVAAQNQMSIWTVPVSIVGSVWSWHRRYQRNIPTKFALALGMLLAMAAFFLKLLSPGELTDTRVVLVELLIHLQVLHSFDQPRRKDLGYSMVIGLILLGVASTLSQTMEFGLLLLLFLAIALPTLALDYRSQLGLSTMPPLARSVPRSLKAAYPLITTFGLTLLLGLLVFAVMPRFSGYQWRTFPMSAQITPPGEFDNRQVINPGYVRAGPAGAGSGKSGGTMQTQGAGTLDETAYSGFGRQINQNLRGRLKPRVMMRVRSQAEGFWRVQAFDRYTGQGWEVSRNEKTKTIARQVWANQFFVPQRVTLNRTREVVQTYTIVADLPNVIPAMAQPKELYFPTRQVAMDAEDGLRAPIELLEGLTYTVISDVPYRNRTLLKLAQVPTPGLYSPHLQMPEAIKAKVRRRTEEILAKSEQPLRSPYEQALYLAQHLKQRYTIQPDLPFLAPTDDLVEAFLFKYKGGYPDHFSTVLTMMLRSIDISARLVVGFAPGQFNPFTGLYVVRNTDAYAMTEIVFPKFGWFAIDPIPGHELIPPSLEDSQPFSLLQSFWKWVAGWLPSPVSSWLNRIFGTLFTELGRWLGWLFGGFTKSWWGFFRGLFGTVLASFLGWLSWQSWRQWRYYRRLKRLPAMERLYRQMLDWLGSQGVGKHPAQTPLEYADQAQTQHPPHRAAVIQAISAAYVQWRYGGTVPDLGPLQRQFKTIRQRQKKPARW